MNKNYDKPFKTYEEQLNHLCINYNLITENKDEAIMALSTLSYYDIINGYQECFRIENKYPPNITFEYLCEFHKFDRNIQNILFKYSIYVETSFKTTLAYILAKDFGEDIDIYLNPENYSRKSSGVRLKKLHSTLNEIKDIPNQKIVQQPTKHYSINKNHIPPWILFKNATFNSTIDVYTFLKEEQKNQVANQLLPQSNLTSDEVKELLKRSISIVRKFRNKIAHNLKFISYKVSKDDEIISLNLQQVLSKSKSSSYSKNHLFNRKKDYIKNKRGVNDIFAMILSIYILLKTSSLGNEFLIELKTLIEEKDDYSIYPDYSKVTNLPLDLAERIKLYLEIPKSKHGIGQIRKNNRNLLNQSKKRMFKAGVSKNLFLSSRFYT